MKTFQEIWNNLNETQRDRILKMARIERDWHYASIIIRHNAEDKHFDGTWLREVLRAFAQCAPAPDGGLLARAVKAARAEATGSEEPPTPKQGWA